MSSNWCTIESDPGVFQELLTSFGVKGVGVKELYTLDDDGSTPQPVFGLIFLFKYINDIEKNYMKSANIISSSDESVSQLFFAKQVIQNACATQAILSVLLNIPTDSEQLKKMNEEYSHVSLGNELTELRSFGIELDPESRGMVVGESDHLRKAHNSFARPESFQVEEAKPSAEGEAYHFVAYIPHQGKVYEIDGLKPGPILIGTYNPDDLSGREWLSVAKPSIESRMNIYASNETHFALLSFIPHRISQLEREISALEEVLSVSKEELMEDVGELEENLSKLKEELIYEKEVEDRYRIENIRRRHNYTPFILTLLKNLAKKDKLNSLVKSAKDKYKAQAAKKLSTK